MTSLQANLQELEQRIAAACRRAGRARTEVTLVAVTKSVDVKTASEVLQAGIHDLGESRPQELWRKAEALSGEVRWHLIGHLQRNKIEKTLPLVTMIHSVDSLRLLQALEEEAARQSRSIDVLLECNASGETNKQGFELAAVPLLLPHLGKIQHVHVRGLMTMAAYDENPANSRPNFAALRQLRDALLPHIEPPHSMTHLSMGMSNDFEVAIEEGATLVRLGTVLFEGLQGEKL